MLLSSSIYGYDLWLDRSVKIYRSTKIDEVKRLGKIFCLCFSSVKIYGSVKIDKAAACPASVPPAVRVGLADEHIHICHNINNSTLPGSTLGMGSASSSFQPSTRSSRFPAAPTPYGGCRLAGAQLVFTLANGKWLPLGRRNPRHCSAFRLLSLAPLKSSGRRRRFTRCSHHNREMKRRK